MTTMQTRPLETGYLDDTPVEDTLVRRYLHNQADLAVLLAAAGGGVVRRRPDGVIAAFETPVVFQNQAIAFRPVTDDFLDEAEACLPGGILLSAWPTADLSPRGWHLMGHPTFVVRGPRPQPVTSTVPVTIVQDEASLALAERVAIEGYPMPEAEGAPAGSAYPPGVLGSPLRVRLGWYDGQAVGVAASHAAHGVLNMCLAATLPQARRQGVWEALAQARLAEAPDLPAVATTSDYSRAGFEKLGFLPVTRMTMWFRSR